MARTVRSEIELGRRIAITGDLHPYRSADPGYGAGMRSIFEPLHDEWDQLTGSIHVYALPSWPSTAVQQWQDGIARSGVCAVQPAVNLHATICRTPAFRPLVSATVLQNFSAVLASLALQRRAFDVPLCRPQLSPVGVVCVGETDASWDALVQDVRGAIAVCFPGVPTPAGPFAPHVSLGYANRPAPDAPLVAELAGLAEEPWDLTLSIDALHLLSVDANERAGTFTWDSIAVLPFAQR